MQALYGPSFERFFFGRTVLTDADLTAQGEYWLENTANRRRHRTLGESPQLRFEHDEREQLQALALPLYPRLGRQPPATTPPRT